MKKIAVLFLAIFGIAFFVSCAEQLTVREREMKKYEKIDPKIVQGMPEAIVKVVEAYNSGDYYTSAIGFYAIMKNDEWDRLHETARYYYAESLFRIGLYQASEYQLAEILFEGTDSHYFISSLLKLLAVTYETNDERVLFAILSNVDYSSLPAKFANELTYYLGKINFYNGQDDQALKMFGQVKDYSSFYPKAKYFMGVIEVRQEMFAEALKSFTEIKEMPDDKYIGADIVKLKGMAELALGQLYYAAAWAVSKDTEREGNPLALFNVSLNYFTNVGRDNEQWFEALFARTWASLMITRFDSTLGTVVTLRSPFFTDIYFPEINVVEAVAYYNLCQYGEVNRVIDYFFDIYPQYSEKMDTWLERVSTKTGLDIYKEILLMYRDAQAQEATALPESVLRTVVYEPLFQRKYAHIKEIEREFELIENSPEAFRTSVIAQDISKKMAYQLTTLRDEAGRMLVNRVQELNNELGQLIADMRAIRFEMTDSQTRVLEKQEVFGREVQEDDGEVVEKEMNPSVPDGYYYWPFDGEYWEDELGYYFFQVENICREQ
jgi:tetratricopeptide (TPR) repeat protein